MHSELSNNQSWVVSLTPRLIYSRCPYYSLGEFLKNHVSVIIYKCRKAKGINHNCCGIVDRETVTVVTKRIILMQMLLD